MKKYNVKYSAEEMAETIHIEVMKYTAMWAYCAANDEISNNKGDWREAERWRREASMYFAVYSRMEDMAFNAGTTVTYDELHTAQEIGKLAAKQNKPIDELNWIVWEDIEVSKEAS